MSNKQLGRGEDEPLEEKDLIAKSNDFANDIARRFFQRDKGCRCKHCASAWVLTLAFLKERILCELEEAEALTDDDMELLEELTADGVENIQRAFDRRADKAAQLAFDLLQTATKETPP